MQYLIQHVEALIFASPEPLSVNDIETCLSELWALEVPLGDIEACIVDLQLKYQRPDVAFGLFKQAGGYQFLSKSNYHPAIQILLKQSSKKQLSKSALETLSIVAYKQPITKPDIEQIRGSNSDYAIQKLLDRELVEIVGKADTPGKPILYGTTAKFMEYFGINSLQDLPNPQDFAQKEEGVKENKNTAEESEN